MSLDTDVDLGPADTVLDVAQLHPKKGHISPLIFGPSLLCPNGWMNDDATW